MHRTHTDWIDPPNPFGQGEKHGFFFVALQILHEFPSLVKHPVPFYATSRGSGIFAYRSTSITSTKEMTSSGSM